MVLELKKFVQDILHPIPSLLKELMRVVRHKYGSPTPSHLSASPLHIQSHPLYAWKGNLSSPSSASVIRKKSLE